MIAHVTLGGRGRPQADDGRGLGGHPRQAVAAARDGVPARPGVVAAVAGRRDRCWSASSPFDSAAWEHGAGRRSLLAALLLVGYLWFWVRVRALAVPTLMLEPVGVFGALGRAVRLTRQQFWRLSGILLLVSPGGRRRRQHRCGCRSASPARCSSPPRRDTGYGLTLYLLLTAVGTVLSVGRAPALPGRRRRPAVRRPAHPQGGLRRRAARPRPGSCPADARRPALPWIPPVTRGAACCATSSLHGEYHQQHLWQRLVDWLWRGSSTAASVRRRAARGSPSSSRCWSRRAAGRRARAPALAAPSRPSHAAARRPRVLTDDRPSAAELRRRAEASLAEGRHARGRRRRVPGARRPPDRARPARRPARRHRARGRGAAGRVVPPGGAAGRPQRRPLRRDAVRRPAGTAATTRARCSSSTTRWRVPDEHGSRGTARRCWSSRRRWC